MININTPKLGMQFHHRHDHSQLAYALYLMNDE